MTLADIKIYTSMVNSSDRVASLLGMMCIYGTDSDREKVIDNWKDIYSKHIVSNLDILLNKTKHDNYKKGQS